MIIECDKGHVLFNDGCLQCADLLIGIPTSLTETMRQAVTKLDDWIDRETSDSYTGNSLASDWGRVAKVAEECGEAVAALIGSTGQNPRKGVTCTKEDLLEELADIVITALCAIQHFTKDEEETDLIVADRAKYLCEWGLWTS